MARKKMSIPKKQQLRKGELAAEEQAVDELCGLKLLIICPVTPTQHCFF